MMNLQEGEVCVSLEEMRCHCVEAELISRNARGMVSRNMLGCCGKETRGRGIHIAKLYYNITITRPCTPLAIAT